MQGVKVTIEELFLLLKNVDGQLALQDKALTGDPDSMIGFVRFCVFKKVCESHLISAEDKAKSFNQLMDLVILTTDKEE